MNMPMNLRLILLVILFGVVQLVHVWRHGLAIMEQKDMARRLIQNRLLWLCNILV